MKPETPLSEADVAAAFRALADEHAKKVEAVEGRRTFQRIQNALAVNQASVSRLPARRLAILTLAPAFAAAGLTLAVSSWLKPGPLSFEVVGAANQGGLIETGEKLAVLTFSDDSQVVAHSDTALNMSLVGEQGALARLREGKLNVKVEHADKTDWRFLAGPYEVRVVGTEFDIGWQPEVSRLSIVMHEGRVRVIGPQKSETVLSAGQSKVFSELPAPELSASEPSSPNLAKPRAEAQLHASVTDAGAASGAALSTAGNGSAAFNAGKPVVKAVSWAKLVGKGRFAEVVEEAEHLGIEHALSTRGSQDLQALAQAAHYTGRSGLALNAWSTARQRFGDRQAAFFMGRIYDQQGNGTSALRWLNVYLSEAGSDVYASEALGRKLTLVRRLSGTAQAEVVAREYLRRFPQGAYAKTARALVQ